MAIQNIKCPNCGGEVQMDDNLEKGFCMYCGGAIHIKEEVAKIKIEHSGKVEIDDSKKLANSILLADRAFAAGNYEESYNYYCSALECDINNIHATFRKGLCAAYISFSRVNELKEAVETSVEIITSTSKDVDGDIYIVFSQLFKYISDSYSVTCNHHKGYAYPDYASVNNAFSVITSLTILSLRCSELITDNAISRHPEFESQKRACLEQGLSICKIGLSSLKYIEGYEMEKDGDNYVQKAVYDTIKSPYYEVQKQCEAKLKEYFNNLPTTRNALVKYDSEIAKLQKDIDIFTEKLEEYFDANPELGEEYKKSIWPFVIPTGIVLTLIMLVGVIYYDSPSNQALAWVIFLLCISFLALGVISIVKLVTCSKNRKRILSELPLDLANLKNIHDQSENRLQIIKRTKNDFIKKNVKK